MKLCSVTQSTHSPAAPTHLLMLRQKMKYLRIFHALYLGVHIFSLLLLIQGHPQHDRGFGNLAEMPPAALANLTHRRLGASER